MEKPGQKLTKGEANIITSIVVAPAMLGFYLMMKMFGLLYRVYKAIFVGAYKLVKLLITKKREDKK